MVSVIDWRRLEFRSYDDVDRFLRVNEFDPKSEADMQRLEALRLDAVDYLMLIASWGFCPGCPADFNGDDVVDAMDFMLLIANWS